jgi:hypothetical protein
LPQAIRDSDSKGTDHICGECDEVDRATSILTGTHLRMKTIIEELNTQYPEYTPHISDPKPKTNRYIATVQLSPVRELGRATIMISGSLDALLANIEVFCND